MREFSSANAQADAAICQAMLRGSSRSFFAASLVLPSGVRKPASALYAFCRMADDAIDQGSDRIGALRLLQDRLDRIYAGEPADIPADRAFTDVVQRFSIPKAYPSALLEGFAWDAAARQYDNLSQLTEYAVRVAGTVGAMMALVMGVRDKALVARACDLGVAMQLTNIARDVGEDARCGRLYLPREWLREAQIEPQLWLSKPDFSEALGSVVERLLSAARELYLRSDTGLAALPAACRPGMFAARLLYDEIGAVIAKSGFDSVNQRAFVPWARKTRLLADALLASAGQASAVSNVTLPEAEFLLSGMPTGDVSHSRQPSARIEQRVVWVLDLFERLERREQSALNRAAVQ